MANDCDLFYLSFEDDDQLNNLVDGLIEYNDDFWRDYKQQSDIHMQYEIILSKIINEINTIVTILDHYYDILDVEVEFFEYLECMIFNYEMYQFLINLLDSIFL